jgi:hypothetical protein
VRHPRLYEEPGCAEVGGDFWFPEKSDGLTNTVEMQIAKSICKKCPHQTECAEWGIAKESFGIWGGLMPRERARARAAKGITLKEENVA